MDKMTLTGKASVSCKAGVFIVVALYAHQHIAAGAGPGCGWSAVAFKRNRESSLLQNKVHLHASVGFLHGDADPGSSSVFELNAHGQLCCRRPP